MKQKYQDQVTLLLEMLPLVFKEEIFVLKGGTAINLFVQAFPRLSIDIDVTYTPLQGRQETLEGIQAGLLEARERIHSKIAGITIKEKYNKQTKTITRLDVLKGDTLVKLEPNLVLRGTVFAPKTMALHPFVQSKFGVEVVNIPVASAADLYGGKLCAALDRQHPRDLFDIKVLFDHGGITEAIKQAFLVYLCSHNRPIHELLNPNFLDQSGVFVSEFQGMENVATTYAQLEQTRIRLVVTLREILNDNDKSFLYSFKQGKPNWTLIGLDDLSHMPGIKWKQINIAKMSKEKHKQALSNLERVLYRK